MIIKIAIILFSILITIFTAKIDAEHILKKEYIKSHNSRWLQRASIALLIGLINPVYGAAFAFTFYAVFDSSLNHFRGLNLAYIGNTAKTDIFLSKNKWLFYTIKALSIGAAIFLWTI